MYIYVYMYIYIYIHYHLLCADVIDREMSIYR